MSVGCWLFGCWCFFLGVSCCCCSLVVVVVVGCLGWGLVWCGVVDYGESCCRLGLWCLFRCVGVFWCF